MRDTTQTDKARRDARELEELLPLIEKYYGTPKDMVDPYHVSRGITGEPSEKNRNYRPYESCWENGLKMTRTVGTADGKRQTVKVTHPSGKTEIVPASSFRKQNIHKRQRQHVQTTVAQTRHMPIRADDPRFGNIGNVD